MTKSVLVINGPNLNLLGTREPGVYGSKTLKELEAECVAHGARLGLKVECFQSNHEGAIIDAIHAARNRADAIVINPGGYSHTSVAIRDALSGAGLPVYEVHISNIHAREAFRHHSHVSAIAKAVVCGLGFRGYLAMLDAVAEIA
ncbi:MAG: type II 3-dehydroquinate dehydratase [Nitratireductor sp.]